MSRMGGGALMSCHSLSPSKRAMTGVTNTRFLQRWCHHILKKKLTMTNRLPLNDLESLYTMKSLVFYTFSSPDELCPSNEAYYHEQDASEEANQTTNTKGIAYQTCVQHFPTISTSTISVNHQYSQPYQTYQPIL